MHKVKIINHIAEDLLELFPADEYQVSASEETPDCILMRSANIHDMELPPTLKAIARAGAGTNNIPVEKCTTKGIVVFNAPGGNANAVKELTIASLIISSRSMIKSFEWTRTLRGKCLEIDSLVEKGKSQFAGVEIKGKTLGVIGVGRIGSIVAKDAAALGMDVIGYDPYISVAAAWKVGHAVKKSESLESLLAKSDYITLHIPQDGSTKNFLNEDKIKLMKDGVRVMNFARGGVVNTGDIVNALRSGKISCYVTDFATEELLAEPNAVYFPHLGGTTAEAEAVCATMAINELRDFVENGNITNSVNFPECTTDMDIPQNGSRLCIINNDVPNMIAQMTSLLANNGINISSMINRNKNGVAYNIIDTNSKADAALKAIENVEDVISARVINRS